VAQNKKYSIFLILLWIFDNSRRIYGVFDLKSLLVDSREDVVKKEQIAKKFEISLLETENHFALLRHCDLVKGQTGQMECTLYLLG